MKKYINIILMLITFSLTTYSEVVHVNTFSYQPDYGDEVGWGDAIISPDDRYIILSGSSTKSIQYDLITKEKVKDFIKSGPSFIHSYAFSHDGTMLLGGGDREWVIWDFETGDIIQEWSNKEEPPSYGYYAPTFSPDDKYISLSSHANVGTIGHTRIWEVDSKKEIYEFNCSGNQTVYSLFSGDNSKFIFGDVSGFTLHDIFEKKVIEEFRSGIDSMLSIKLQDISKNFKKFSIIEANSRENIYRRKIIEYPSKRVLTLESYNDIQYSGWPTFYSKDRRFTITEFKSIDTFSHKPKDIVYLKTGKLIARLSPYLQEPYYMNVSFSNSTKYIVCASYESVEVYDISQLTSMYGAATELK